METYSALANLVQLVANRNIKRVEIRVDEEEYTGEHLPRMDYVFLVKFFLEKKRGILGTNYRKRETLTERLVSLNLNDFGRLVNGYLNYIKKYLEGLPEEIEVVGLDRL